jgi:hypothetical protein
MYSGYNFRKIETKDFTDEEKEEISVLYSKGNFKALGFSYMLNCCASILFLRTGILMVTASKPALDLI